MRGVVRSPSSGCDFRCALARGHRDHLLLLSAAGNVPVWEAGSGSWLRIVFNLRGKSRRRCCSLQGAGLRDAHGVGGRLAQVNARSETPGGRRYRRKQVLLRTHQLPSFRATSSECPAAGCGPVNTANASVATAGRSLEAGRGSGYQNPCSRRFAACSGRQAARLAAPGENRTAPGDGKTTFHIHNSPLFGVWGHGRPRNFQGSRET